MDKEIFLVEELENRLAIEAVRYKHKIDEEWETNRFDPSYFDNFITGSLYAEFIQALYDRVKPLNSHEANRFLTLSVAQFKTHTPEKRFKDFVLNYWHTKWFPNLMSDDVADEDVKYATHIWNHYTNHFHLFSTSIDKAVEDFKAGFIGSQPTHSKTDAITPTIKYEAFNHYLKQFQYNYPYQTTVFDFKFSMKDYLDYFRTEILENIVHLDKDNRKPYLNKLKYELESKQEHAYTKKETIDEWLTKYNLASEDAIRVDNSNNELYKILATEPPKFEEEFEENFNRDTHGIQTDFYNYYYGTNLVAAIAFIDEQILQLHPLQLLPTSTIPAIQSSPPTNPKLKTNLSVPQLSYLFKMLMDINPPIFDIKTKKELYQFIEANFTTKGKENVGPTVAKLNNLYSDVDKATATFWAEKLSKLLQDARKV